ncbi:heavy metal translocating P-type ATPase [Alkalihalobacillus trypoxylicola]|uniref:Cd(2+)-exporting ATPase n=1 Tax=Alkalihalobacillus trypoxylicola TaxID=519424 RepID=A0A162E7G2_9BACI|nr:heavy metal translocating P-type ATPase [Alkalihalobacillus trypoxylicola]KYG31960.1 cadmium transporter [Alkalihalobacillus trypoxylicola]
MSEQEFYLKGLSCASCAATFEENLNELKNVKQAKVNFGASKLTLIGDASIAEIEKAGQFDGIKIVRESEEKSSDDVRTKMISFFKSYANVMLSIVLVLLGLFIQLVVGETNLFAMIAYLSAMVIGGYSLFITGVKHLFKMKFDMKALMTIAVIGAAIIGEYIEGSIVVILFAISEALEQYSMDRARRSIKDLMDITPKKALIKKRDQNIETPVQDIQIGDIMIVKPGQKLAMDGVIRTGAASINEAAITGESLPVDKKVNDLVYAGTLNQDGLLEIEVTKYVKDTTIAKIIHLVEEAQAERAPSQAFVDKFAQYYTPAIILVAIMVAILPPLFMGGSWNDWIYQGLAVLVVGCPCALVISTPVAITSAIGNLAKQGVLVKGGVHLESIGTIRAVAFDKTGTLTKGTPVITNFVPLTKEIDEALLFKQMTAIEDQSTHPLSKAFITRANEWELAYQDIKVEAFQAIAGKGLIGKLNETIYMLGNLSLFAQNIKEETIEKIKQLQNEGKTVVLFGTKEEVLALIAIADQVRLESKKVIKKLHQLGVTESIMLTGDNQQTAEAVGKQIGVTSVQSELLPEDKLNVMKQLKKQHAVAMVGDGINDAPALATANVGIAMGGTGTDTALETADIALMSDDLNKIPFTIKVSRKALIIIKQNIAFSLGIKALALLLVIPNWLTLWLAILADLGATLLVTLNGMRLMKMKDHDKKGESENEFYNE